MRGDAPISAGCTHIYCTSFSSLFGGGGTRLLVPLESSVETSCRKGSKRHFSLVLPRKVQKLLKKGFSQTSSGYLEMREVKSEPSFGQLRFVCKDFLF